MPITAAYRQPAGNKAAAHAVAAGATPVGNKTHARLWQVYNRLIINGIIKGRLSRHERRPFGARLTAFWKAKCRLLFQNQCLP